MGHKQTSGYHKTRVLNKIRLFDRFQSKESELDRFEKLRSCAALTTWSWHQGYGYIVSMLPVLASLSTSLTIEFLPVYIPSQEERETPHLFAENVRNYFELYQTIFSFYIGPS